MTLSDGSVVPVTTAGLFPYTQDDTQNPATSLAATGVSPQVPATAANTVQPSGTTYVYWFVGFLLLLAVLKWASEHDKAEMELGDVRIGVWNIFITGVSAALFIFVAKVGVNKYPKFFPTPLQNIVNTI